MVFSWLLALLALFVQPQPVPSEFRSTVLARGYSVVAPGEFIGVRSVASDGEVLYAGLIWLDGQIGLETGP